MRVAGTRSVLSAVVMLVGLSSAALAQTPVQPQPTDPNMPSRQSTPPEKVAPDATTGSSGTLSDRLSNTDGVVKPPADNTTDMRVIPPAPGAGTMPIITPNETTGGAQPK